MFGKLRRGKKKGGGIQGVKNSYRRVLDALLLWQRWRLCCCCFIWPQKSPPGYFFLLWFPLISTSWFRRQGIFSNFHCFPHICHLCDISGIIKSQLPSFTCSVVFIWPWVKIWSDLCINAVTFIFWVSVNTSLDVWLHSVFSEPISGGLTLREIKELYYSIDGRGLRSEACKDYIDCSSQNWSLQADLRWVNFLSYHTLSPKRSNNKSISFQRCGDSSYQVQ